MNLELDAELRLLAESLTGWLLRHLPFERRKSLNNPEAQHSFWREIAGSLGLPGAGLPTELGGFGGGQAAHMVVMETLGASLAPTPYVETAVLAGSLLQRVRSQQTLASGIASAEALAVAAWEEEHSRGSATTISTTATWEGGDWHLNGQKRAVRWGAEADTLLVSAITSDGLSIFRVEPTAAGLVRHPYRLIDDHPACDVILSGARGEFLAGGEDASAALLAAVDAATAAVCAEAVGLMRTMLADTVEYTRQRRQFGQPLSSFQVLQHRMVDMNLQVEQAAAAALLAALTPEQPAAVSAAKVTVGEALRYVSQQAVQLHGAMGLTEELRIGHYFRRATAIENQLGNSDWHLTRYRQLRVA